MNTNPFINLTLLTFTFVIIKLTSATEIPNKDQFVAKVYFSNVTDAEKIRITYENELLETNYSENYHILDLSDNQVSFLKKAGFLVEHTTKKNHNQLPVSTNQKGGVPNYPCYRTVEETYAMAQAMVASNPMLASWIDIGDSWEKVNGFGGYDIYALKLTNHTISGTRPKLLITGAVHAREMTTAELAARFAEQLFNNYGKDADVTWLLDYHEAHFIFFVNPDGRKHAEKGESWRKNTNQKYCGATSSNRGCDLNRNFNHIWGSASTDPCNLSYQGPSGGSEPETQAVQNYMATIWPSKPTDGLSIDLHCYGQIFYSSGSSGINTLRSKLGYFNGYTKDGIIEDLYGEVIGQKGYVYTYASGKLGVPGILIELGTAFFQDCNTAESIVFAKNLPLLKYAFKAARSPYVTSSGPDVYNLELSNNNIAPGTAVTLKATVDDTRYKGNESTQNIASANYYIDTPPWKTGAVSYPMTASNGSFDNKIEDVQTVINTSSLIPGKHIIFVQGKDAGGKTGEISAIFLTIAGSTNTSFSHNNTTIEKISLSTNGSVLFVHIPFTITSLENTLSIYSISGRQLLNQPLTQTDGNFKININQLKAGTYFFKSPNINNGKAMKFNVMR
jgi:murein tripeptide amidase MpaA